MKTTPQTVAKDSHGVQVGGRKRILVQPRPGLGGKPLPPARREFRDRPRDELRVAPETHLVVSSGVVLIDLFSFPSDILKVLDIIGSSRKTIPIIILHVYQQRNPAMEDAIQKAADLVLFKPVDVDEIGSSITRLLEQRAH